MHGAGHITSRGGNITKAGGNITRAGVEVFQANDKMTIVDKVLDTCFSPETYFPKKKI